MSRVGIGEGRPAVEMQAMLIMRDGTVGKVETIGVGKVAALAATYSAPSARTPAGRTAGS